ncbi:hypothetical protein KDH_30480 [Dictyobacter sp. S3.2.2.5]|uniref:Spheroidene monooxygenase n=1 Tax=Dictyobacter halimunensis TaxID=3026934 RepID=A0ABQ6FPQ5_9CHLR|nr:hypothetical protein KDH_30480 [Dictyobacter sp. S3.2.2.5]
MNIADHEPVVAFTLARYPRRERVRALAHLGLDRWPLAHVPGLRFWRLLGVGQGRVFDPHADLHRYALFTVWRSLEDLRRFENTSAVMGRIYQRAEEAWTVHMLPVSWHGTWGGNDPFQGFVAAPPPQADPWIILTRATIRSTRVRAFLRAVPAVAEQLLQQPALLQSVGVGEAPLFYQATLSLWSTLPSVKRFAYSQNAHADVIKRTRKEQWYREEMFARFRPLASFGTWDGIDPLGTLTE